MSNILQATYLNGKWGSNRASVTVGNDGSATFCNGFADPIVYPSYAAAKVAFHSFLSGKQVAA